MANIANEPWMDPAKNAAVGVMEGTTVKPVMIIDPTSGGPTSGGSQSVWDRIPGNSIDFTYYTGAVAGNPSGNTDNLQSAVYSTGGTTQFTQTFTYDATDRVESVVCS